MNTRSLFLGAAALAGLLSIPAAGGRTAPAIECTVVLASDSLARVRGIDVRLVAFSDTGVSLVATGTSDAQGRFRFPAVPADSSVYYRMEGLYAGVWQPGEPFVTPPVGARLAVFDTTSSATRIAVEKLHLILNPLESGIAVTAIYILRNDGPIYLGAPQAAHDRPRVALEFFLPSGAEDVQVFDGSLAGHRMPTERGFGSLVPFYPGIDTLVFGYTLPWDGKRLRFPVESPYPVSSLSVITMQGTAQLSVEGAERVSSEEAPDLVAYGRRAVPAGTPVMVEVRAPGVGRFPLSWAIVIALGVALIGGAAAIAWRRRTVRPAQTRSTEAGGIRSATTPDSTVDALVDEIARLDEEHETGSILEAEYANKRRELKEKLVQALRQPGEPAQP